MTHAHRFHMGSIGWNFLMGKSQWGRGLHNGKAEPGDLI